MTSIPLRNTTIRSYMGSVNFNSCYDISEVHLHESSTRQGHYDMTVRIRLNGTAILGSTCSCPVGHKCKHIYKVLRRIAAPEPIGGPSPRHSQRAARRRQYLARMERRSLASPNWTAEAITIDLTISRIISTNRSWVSSFPWRKPIGAPKNIVDELGHEVDDDEDEDMDDTDDDDDDDDEPFVYDGSDFGEYDDDNAFDKVWVERRAIEDASAQFPSSILTGGG